jgi:hypothetical protein
MAEKRQEPQNVSFLYNCSYLQLWRKLICSYFTMGKFPFQGASGRAPRIDESPPTNRMMKWPFKYKSLEPQTWWMFP